MSTLTSIGRFPVVRVVVVPVGRSGSALAVRALFPLAVEGSGIVVGKASKCLSKERDEWESLKEHAVRLCR